MKRNFLKDLGLTDEQINSILDEAGKDLESTKTSLNEEITKLKGDITSRDAQLGELKEASKNSGDLQSKIAELQEKNKLATEQYEAKIKQIHIDSAVKEALATAKAKNQNVVKPLLADFLSKAEINEGVVKGLDEEIKKLTEDASTSFLFETKPTVTVKGMTVVDGADPNGEKFDMKTASYEELVKYQEAHPEINIFEN